MYTFRFFINKLFHFVINIVLSAILRTKHYLRALSRTILHESDNLCRIITMFEDLILALALRQCMQNAVPHQMYYIFFISKSQQTTWDKRR